MSVEPDNIIENANDSGVSSEGERSAVVDGAIDFGNDVDFYQFQADAGEDVILDLDANESGSALDGRLRLFDSVGNEIGNNDDRPAPGEATSLDPFLSFTVSDTDDYFVGISSVSNSDYDPNVVSDELSTQAVVGEYALEITLVDDVSASDSDNTISEAIATGLDTPGQSASFSDEIDNVADVDIYQVQLGAGDALVVDVYAGAIDSELFASDLRIFDAEGNDLGELATIDDSRLSKDTRANRIGGDPNLTFIAESAGDYYVGVSGGGFDAPTYNPINGINSDESVASGVYNIDFEIVTVGSDNDPDNTLAEAKIIEDSPASTVVTEQIENGDDVDLVRIQLDAGETLNLDIDTSNDDLESDLALRLFDDSGTELASADDDFVSENAPSYDPILTFTPETTGEYYVGVAFAENSDYDPIAGTSNLPQQNEAGGGDYELKIEIDTDNPDEPAVDPDATITQAIATELDSTGQSATFSQAIEPIEDVDLYRVQLDAGEGLVLDLDAAEFLPLGKSASGLDSLIRLFDSSGNELAVNDDGLGSGEEFSLDSFLSFIASSTGDYYVGISSAVNSEYDPVTGANLGVKGGNTGDYDLNIDLVEVVTIDEDPDNTLEEAMQRGLGGFPHERLRQEAIAIEIDNSGSITSDTIESQTDVDLYRVQLDAGDNLLIDLDANELGSDLDSGLRLFDAAGNELVSVDDATAPGEESSLDSFIDFTAEFAGDYFIGVSDIANANSQYDPVRGITNLSQPTGNTQGSYDLNIEIIGNTVESVFADFERLAGTDSADVLSGNRDSTFIDAGGGDDVVTGGSNDDYFIGGAGSDILSGNKGNDTLIGGRGFDVLSGGEGDDFLQGDEDTNILIGGAGADIFAIANNGNNTISDFELGIDKIQLTSGVSFSDLTIEDVAAQSGVVISASSNNITTVLGVNASNLSETDFITA